MEDLYRVMIPNAVAGELARRPGAPGSNVPSLKFVETLSPEPEDVRRVASGPPPIHAGEREVLALALGREATAVMDDRSGRSRGRRLGITLTGTLGVLLALQHASRARRTLAEDLDALEEAGMYLTPDLRRRVVDRLGTDEALREGS